MPANADTEIAVAIEIAWSHRSRSYARGEDGLGGEGSSAVITQHANGVKVGHDQVVVTVPVEIAAGEITRLSSDGVGDGRIEGNLGCQCDAQQRQDERLSEHGEPPAALDEGIVHLP